MMGGYRSFGVLAGLIATTVVVGCQVDWGGARLELEDPAPPPDTTAVVESEEEPLEPLPEDPMLYVAGIDPSGSARVTVAATIGPTGLGDIAYPTVLTERYRARFDSVFLAPGIELSLLAAGGRIGTLVLGSVSRPASPACPSVAAGTVLLTAGATPPRVAFALPADLVGSAPARARLPETTRSMTVAGPVLAERLIDNDRAFLAQRTALHAVEITGDTLAGMAATYLVADSMAPGPPAGDAISLFFLARFEPTRGFITLWREVRSYSTIGEKEAFDHLDWIPTPQGRVDLLRRIGGAGVRLVAGLETGDGSERSIDWIEPAGCRSLELIGAAGG